MRYAFRSLALIFVLNLARAAAAHFLWLEVDEGQKPAQANLWFSETCASGEAKLLDKVSQTKTWLRRADGAPQPIELEKRIAGDSGAWSTELNSPLPACVEASCDYGVVSRGGE